MDILTENDISGEYPISYYTATTDILQNFRRLDENLTCDVCVVGGGYTGLSTALTLSEAGYDVILLEAQRVAFGASGRNGGQVCSGQRWDVVDLKRRFGIEKTKMLWNIGEAAKMEVHERIKKHSIDCDYAPGIIHAELKEKSLDHGWNEVQQLNNLHSYDKIKFLDRLGIRNYLGTDKYAGGSIDMGAGHLHPLKFGIGLASAADKNGVRIFENSRVKEIKKGSQVEVVTEQSKIIKSQYLVLGCNGYLGNLAPSVASRVMPINNFIIATESLGKEKAENIIRNNLAVADSKFVVNYYRLSSDYRLLFGGGENYRYRFPKDISGKVRTAMQDIYPQLSDIKIEYSWGGTLAVTMSRLPDFRRVSPNIYSASGYSGQGVAMATMAGRVMSDLIRGHSERFDILSNLPTPMFPGGVTFRWPLMALAMLWYSMKDKF